MDTKGNATALLLALALVAGGLPARADDAAGSQPTVQEAQKFMDDAEARLRNLAVEAGRAGWVQSNFITLDTELLAAVANDRLIGLTTELAQGAQRFDGLDLPPELARKLKLLKLALTLPAPADAKKRAELTRIAAAMEAAYGAGKWCPPGKTGEDCLDLEELSKTLRESRDPDELLEAWDGLARHLARRCAPTTRATSSSPTRARASSASPTSAPCGARSYDMPPDEFAAETDRLWEQVKPLYDCAPLLRARRARREVRRRRRAAEDRAHPAHLLGNMWAQEWGNVYDLVAPPGGGSSARRHQAAGGEEGRRRSAWSSSASASSPRSASTRCRRPSGSARCS